MELYGSYTSPFVRHCRTVVLQTAVECTFTETAARSARSPTRRVPYLQDGKRVLTDSASIVRHLREKAGQPFLPNIGDYDRFCMVNTALDSSVNLFLLEKEGLTPDNSAYLQRQKQRVGAVLTELDSSAPDQADLRNDADLCYLDWGVFRRLISLEELTRLAGWLRQAQEDKCFAETAPRD